MNSKIRKCRDLKHKLAALQRSAEELFVCQYGSEQSMHLRCDVTYPHIANIFLEGTQISFFLTKKKERKLRLVIL